MAKEHSVMLYGNFSIQPTKIKHETTWIEYGGIPEKIYESIFKKVDKVIQKEIKNFEKKCDCDVCKEKRAKK